ncbi:hypothetical protein ACLOJK_024669 [Asimina triloba]
MHARSTRSTVQISPTCDATTRGNEFAGGGVQQLQNRMENPIPTQKRHFSTLFLSVSFSI